MIIIMEKGEAKSQDKRNPNRKEINKYKKKD